jgi:dihydroxy-acid dehydratase
MSDSQDFRKFSSPMLDGPDRAPSRAMLYAVGFEKEDFAKPQIGVASTWSEVTPCNIHIDKLARESANGVDAAGGKSVVFNTITISDGISMGTEGMKYSLVSREVIADSIETVVGCEGMDGFVAIGGCDKNMPACVIAMGRMNRPSVFVYGGTILPGCATIKGEKKDLDIVSVFEAVGKHAGGEYSDEELDTVERCAIPGPGSCGGMYTANTMASAIEALGMSLPNSSAQAAISDDKMRDCFDAGAAVMNMIKLGIKPRDIMTKEAFENAITVLIALGGSTNACLHIPAMAHAAGVEITIDDFVKVQFRIADITHAEKIEGAKKLRAGKKIDPVAIQKELNDVDPAKHIGRAKARPMLYLHGDKDDVVPVVNNDALFKATKQPKERILMPGGHVPNPFELISKTPSGSLLAG